MVFTRRHLKRILIDASGYGLLLLALLTGWLPGPGGILLALAGFGLLSVYNPWAKRLRRRFISGSNMLTYHLLFAHPLVRLAYDFIIVTLVVAAVVFLWHRGACWEIAVAGIAIGVAIGLSFVSRERYQRMFSRAKRKP